MALSLIVETSAFERFAKGSGYVARILVLDQGDVPATINHLGITKVKN